MFLKLLILSLGVLGVSNVGSRKVLRVVTGEYPTVMKAENDSSGNLAPVGGAGSYYLQWLALKYDYEYPITKYYGRTPEGYSLRLGSRVNGSWTGVMKDLTDNVAEMAIGAFGPRHELHKDVEFTYPWAVTTFAMFIPFPQEEKSVWSFLKPFSVTVWLILLFSFLCVSVSLWGFQKPQLNTCHNQRAVWETASYQHVCLYLLAVISTQGGSMNFQRKSSFIVALVWCLGCVVLVYAYNGLLTSYLTANIPRPIVTSLEDLANKPNVPIFTFYNSWADFSFKAAQVGTKKTLGDRLRAEPNVVVYSIEECMEKVVKNQAVCFMETRYGDTISKKTWTETNQCLITSVDRGFLQYNPCFLLRKNSSSFADVNKGIVWANAFGLTASWVKLAETPYRPCRLEVAKAAGSKNLGLKNLTGPFIVLLIGSLTASLVLVIENVYRSLK